MTGFYKNFFTSNLRIRSSFFTYFFADFYLFWNFETMNSSSVIFEFSSIQIPQILLKCAEFINPPPGRRRALLLLHPPTGFGETDNRALRSLTSLGQNLDKKKLLGESDLLCRFYSDSVVNTGEFSHVHYY
jgi:hypothetical protein